MQLSITSNAVDYTNWKYIIVIDDVNVYVSDVPILLFAKRTALYIGCQYTTTVTPTILKLIYIEDLNDWIAEPISSSTNTGVTIVGSGSDKTTNIYQISGGTDRHVQYNGTWYEEAKSSVASFTNTLSLPQGLTEDRVNELIDITINSTTNISSNANSLQQQAINNYQQYIDGTITLNQLTVNLNNIVNQLNTLNQQPDATLADKVAINNALTNTQIINDSANKDAIIDEMQNDLQVSSSVSSAITGKINQANQTFQNYSQGSITQSEAVTQINTYITYLTGLITPQSTTADIEAINTAINTVNGIKDSLTSYSDLDSDISESAQLSDQEEIDYLENIEAETTDNIDSLKDKVDNSISESQANEVKEQVIEPILQNTLLVKILPIAGLFMVLAVTLGFRYRL